MNLKTAVLFSVLIRILSCIENNKKSYNSDKDTHTIPGVVYLPVGSEKQGKWMVMTIMMIQLWIVFTFKKAEFDEVE